MRLTSKTLLIGTAVVLTAAPLLSVPLPHPNHERGFEVGKAFQIGEVDSVSMMNGNLVLTIPIGQSYPVGPGLSFELVLVWNSNHWDYEVFPDDDPATAEIEHRTEAWPHQGFTAGLGWHLGLGRVLPPASQFNDTTSWVYVGKDMSNHRLYPTLHTGDPADSALYSRDGSYIRMSVSGGQRIVELPDDTRHTFELDTSGEFYRPISIENRFGDAITISYGPNSWTITDSHDRTHTVTLFDFTPSDWDSKVITEVRLEAFDGSDAVYNFSYNAVDLVRACPHNDDELENPLTLPLLSSVELPDGSKYSMPDYVVPSTSLLCGAQPGRIEALELPTGGRIEWTYQTYSFPRPEGPFSPPPAATTFFESSIGVATRTVVNADGTVAGTWQYESALTPNLDGGGGGPGLAQPNELVNSVVDPFSNKTVHYFSVDMDGTAYSDDWSAYDYGLPFTRDSDTILPGPSPGPEDDLFLSTRTFDPSGTPVRSTYVRYEKDVKLGLVSVEQTQDMNRRLVAERTVFHDDNDRWTQTVRSSFDGVGHHRVVEQTGNFEGTPKKTVTTQYNPGRNYEVDTSGNLIGAYNMIPASAPWILNNHTFQTVRLIDGGFNATSRVERTFDANTGRLRCQRTLKGTSRGQDDILVVFTDSNNDGFTDRESHYGGDLQALPTAAGCGTGSLQAEYRLDHQYESGVLRSTDYVQECDGSGNGGHVLRVVDLDINARTGLVSASRDPSGLRTDYLYDDLGRLSTIKPQQEAWTVYDLRPASSTEAATATVFRKNAGSSTRLTQQRLVFDGFGRVCVTQEKLPEGGLWSRQDSLYHPTGWKKEESIAYETSALATECPTAISENKTTFEDYDPYGRVGTIIAPDAHEVSFAYEGVRQVERTVTIATQLNGAEAPATTSEIYDPLGQLARVVEPGGDATDYSYDEGGRLRLVSQGVQSRVFDFDGRGLLTSERHPELGNGATFYCNYDSRGNAHRKVEGVAATYICSPSSFGHNDLTFVFDRAERVTQVLETLSGDLMKELFYYRDNAPGEFREGKLALAKRHNRGVLVFPLAAQAEADLVVTETYTYAGVGGRVSSRQTRFTGYTFDLGATYDTLGNVATLTYPSCSHAGCSAPPRTVSFGYTQGRLTSVPGYASSVSYHENGLVNQVHHTNGVTDTQVKDPSGIARPGAITFSGFPGDLVGMYQYDGAANVKKIGGHRYRYDLRSRIAAGDLGTLGVQSYVYDRYGNRTKVFKDGVAYDYPASSTTNRLTGNGSLYDAAGNLLRISDATISQQNYGYDVFNMMVSVQSSSFAANYVYTADDERFVEIDTSGPGIVATYTLRGLGNEVLRRFEHVWGTGWFWEKDYVHRGGLILASDSPEGVRHFHLDHLGTPRLITDGAGSQVAQHAYFPFGEEASPSAQDSEYRKFTGHERDSNGVGPSDDMDYMHARYCSSTLGRFLSVDPINSAVSEAPQSWNRFSYAAGNPLKFTDSDGRELRLGSGSHSSMLDAAQLMVAPSLRKGIGLGRSASGNTIIKVDNTINTKDINFKNLQRVVNSPGVVEMSLVSEAASFDVKFGNGTITTSLASLSLLGITLPSEGTKTANDNAFSTQTGITEVRISGSTSAEKQAAVVAAELGAHALPALLGQGATPANLREHHLREDPLTAAARANAIIPPP